MLNGFQEQHRFREKNFLLVFEEDIPLESQDQYIEYIGRIIENQEKMAQCGSFFGKTAILRVLSISDHQHSGGYGDGPCKAETVWPQLPAADFCVQHRLT